MSTEAQTQETENGAVEPKKQKKSVSYALKAAIGHFETLTDAGLMDDKEKKTVADILKKSKEKTVRKV